MRVVHQPVEDGVPEGGVADHLVPVLDGELAGHERGAPPGAFLDELEEIAPLPVAEGREPPVVEDQEIGLRERLHQFPVGAIGARVHELFAQEAWQSHIAHGVALATGALAERTR